MSKEISLCVISKNQGEFLFECLNHVKDIVNEMIIIDTGSSDDSLDIINKFDCDPIQIEQGDLGMSELRNMYLEKATKDWILVLDPDERISNKDLHKIRDMIEDEEFVGYYLIQRQYKNDIGTANWKSSIDDSYVESKIASGWYEIPMIRLFKNDKRIKYEGKIHEVIDHSIRKSGKVRMSDIPIHHYGEINRDELGKADRNIELLKKDLLVNEREKFFVYYQMGCELLGKGEKIEAINYLEKSVNINSNFAPSLFNLGSLYIMGNVLDKAEMLLKRSLSLETDNIKKSSICDNLGILYIKLKDFNNAIKYFLKAIEMNPGSADAHYNLGLVYKQRGSLKEMREYFDKAVELNPLYKNKIRL
jgi:tetratricopeptide (TPR) repeat protein